MIERLVFGSAIALAMASAAADSPSVLMARYAQQAWVAPTFFSPSRGEALYRSEHTGRDGKPVSCASCHTADPRQAGQTRVGKRIEPLAPAANPQRFTDAAKAEKWFRRNCQDVLGRACTPQEKGDFIAWLSQIK
jgi:cytochrome c peroxidase